MKLKFQDRLKQGLKHPFKKAAVAFRKWKEQWDAKELEYAIGGMWNGQPRGGRTIVIEEALFYQETGNKIGKAALRLHTRERAFAEIKKALQTSPRWMPIEEGYYLHSCALDALHYALIGGVDIEQFIPRVIELLSNHNRDAAFKAKVLLVSFSDNRAEKRPMETILKNHSFLAMEIAKFMKSPEMIELAEENRSGYSNLIDAFAQAMKNIEDAGTIGAEVQSGSS